MPRPTEIECESCGAVVSVAPQGRVPKRCANCRASRAIEPETIKVDPAPVAPLEQEDDGWPQRIAPCAWLDQKGRRYTDLGEALAAADECRGM